jgi:tRNA pseudouridine38-40 synthase
MARSALNLLVSTKLHFLNPSGVYMRNIKLTIEYEGTNYHGWQSQSNASTVQDVIENAINSLTGETCDLMGCSRTDTGVHALGHVANFFTSSKIPADRFAYALNTKLPSDVVIKNSEEVSSEFHARFMATGKKYRYLIYNSLYPSALLRNRAYHVTRPLNLELMNTAAQQFLGKHDFSAFRASGSDTKTSERTITGVWLKRDGDVIEFEIQGDGFLYNMVRIIAGTLVEVGYCRISAESITDIIQSKDRTKAGRTAPAHGLYLMEVYY